MRVVYARAPFPDRFASSLFLAGPTPRDEAVPSWRPEALRVLASLGYDGVVFVPESGDGSVRGDYTDQVEWEREALRLSDRIAFWVPRDLATMPAFTTNVEFGTWASSGRSVLGFPPEAPKNRYLAWLAEVQGIPCRDTLEGTLRAALEPMIPAPREGGERFVPQLLWHTPGFQRWLQAQRAAGNRLDGAEPLWHRTVPRTGAVFLWVLGVKVWVASEGRHKSREVVLSRPDLSSVVLHGPLRGGATEVLLVREFRSPVRNAEGTVREFPGGSSDDPALSPDEVALEEVREETSLALEPSRLRPLGSRQAMATLSSHHAHGYVAELTDDELTRVRALCAEATVLGVSASERITLELRTVASILGDRDVDWSTVGLLAQALWRP
ncbi:MAG: NUDIX domain-containing protein [Deltaproteobacteria bacterium]|nr:NUDIX domain-containing protein [Deltaproteobacteria bacterium]